MAMDPLDLKIEMNEPLKDPGHPLDQKDPSYKNHIPIVVETVSQTPEGNEINSDVALLDNEKDLRGLYEFLCHIYRLSSGPLMGIEILEATDTETKNEPLFQFDFKSQCSTYFKRMNKLAFPVEAHQDEAKISFPQVYMYFGAEANSNPDHIGKLKVIDDVVMFINNKAYFSLPFTKEEAEGICKFLAFIKQNHIVETIGDISNIETYHSKEWEEQLELEQINQKEWAKLDEDDEKTS